SSAPARAKIFSAFIGPLLCSSGSLSTRPARPTAGRAEYPQIRFEIFLSPSPLAGESLSGPLPPCGGGLGWGVRSTWAPAPLPPTPALPRKGGGRNVLTCCSGR